MMKLENWNPEGDQYLKAGERELHKFLHTKRAEKVESWESILGNKQRRWQPLQAAAERSGGISGRMLEVGAGDGWCSAGILRHYPGVTSAHIMEIDEAAVGTLIPRTLEAFEVADRDITLVLGSFNNIPHRDYYDVVVAMGALHHSENLFLTLRSLWLALKPGGRLLSQEPAMADTTPNDFYSSRNEKVATFQEGIEIRNEERSDNFYRRCEYLTALYHAGFDVEVVDLPPTHPQPAPAPVKKPAKAKKPAPPPPPPKRTFWQKLLGIKPKPSVVSMPEPEPEAVEAPPAPTPGPMPQEPKPLTPVNVFLLATKPLNAGQNLPTTAWETI